PLLHMALVSHCVVTGICDAAAVGNHSALLGAANRQFDLRTVVPCDLGSLVVSRNAGGSSGIEVEIPVAFYARDSDDGALRYRRLSQGAGNRGHAHQLLTLRQIPARLWIDRVGVRLLAGPGLLRAGIVSSGLDLVLSDTQSQAYAPGQHHRERSQW